MNLHQLVRSAIGSVNPETRAVVQISAGSMLAQDGKRVPIYAKPRAAMVQVQALTFNDLQQIDGLNIQGTKRALYLNGHWDGLVRLDNKGGDLITMENGETWLVTQVLEHWPDWTKVAVTQQIDSPEKRIGLILDGGSASTIFVDAVEG